VGPRTACPAPTQAADQRGEDLVLEIGRGWTLAGRYR
jgi:hypothetical protein